ncbi:MAG: hypothetical protein RCO49_00040 [Rickettsia endosymbiont of Argas persicus]
MNPNLSDEEREKKYAEIFEKFGEDSWASYTVPKPGGGSNKISYEEYEKIVINEAKNVQ